MRVYDRDVEDNEGFRHYMCRRIIQQSRQRKKRSESRGVRVNKLRVKTVVRWGSFTLPGEIVAAEAVDWFKLELDRYLGDGGVQGYLQDL